MMTPREFRDEAAKWLKTIHPRARIGLATNFDHGKPIWANLDAPGISGTECCLYAETFDEILPALAKQWETKKINLRERRLKEIHAELAAMGEG